MSSVLEWAAAIMLVLACLTAIGVMLKRLWMGMRRAVHVADIIQKQLTPNGGESIYDRARVAAEAAVRSELKAAQVAEELAAFRAHQAEDSAVTSSSVRKLQHDVTNIRAGQEMLLGKQDALKSDVDRVRIQATEARDIAGVAAGEAQAGRAVTGEHAENVRRQVGEVRQVVASLTAALEQDQKERQQKERAYVAALNQIGVPLLPIADELEGGHA